MNFSTYKKQFGKNGNLLYKDRKKFESLLQKKRKTEYKSKLKAYSEFLKTDLECNHYSILQLFQFKLSRQLKYLSKNRFLHMNKKYLRQIQEVISLLELVFKSDFGQPQGHAKLMRKWRPIIRKHRGNLPSKMQKRLETEYKKITTVAFLKRKKTLEKAFQLITENIWNWWEEEYAGDYTPLTGKIQILPQF